MSEMQSKKGVPADSARSRAEIVSPAPCRAVTAIPAVVRSREIRLRFVRLSSMTRTLLPSKDPGMIRTVFLSSLLLSHPSKWKVLTVPIVLSTHKRPLMNLAICRVMESPRPVPPYFLVVEPSTCLNVSNMDSFLSKTTKTI